MGEGVLGVDGVIELVVDVEVAGGHDLEETLAVEVDRLEAGVGVLLVVDVGVGEAEWWRGYPFDMIRPIDLCWCSLVRLTP